MNEIIEQKIKAARQEVENEVDPKHPERKDGLQEMLNHAYRCANGSPDKIGAIADAVAALIIHSVRAEIREPLRMQEAVDAHEEKCRASRIPRSVREALMSAAAQYPLVTLLVVGWLIERGYLAQVLKGVFQ